METLEAISTRRSVRAFSNQPISENIIDKILHAAMQAPSAHNEQPWHFLVINDRNILDKIPTIHPYAQMCLEAPMAIIPCFDPNLKKTEGFWVQDLAASVQNMLLAIRALGLGAVWVGVYPNEMITQRVKNLLNLPEHIIPFNIIPIGHTNVEQNFINRYQKNRIHYNRW